MLSQWTLFKYLFHKHVSCRLSFMGLWDVFDVGLHYIMFYYILYYIIICFCLVPHMKASLKKKSSQCCQASKMFLSSYRSFIIQKPSDLKMLQKCCYAKHQSCFLYCFLSQAGGALCQCHCCSCCSRHSSCLSSVSLCSRTFWDRHMQNNLGFAVEDREVPTTCETRDFSSKRKQQLCSSAFSSFVLYLYRVGQREYVDTIHREIRLNGNLNVKNMYWDMISLPNIWYEYENCLVNMNRRTVKVMRMVVVISS